MNAVVDCKTTDFEYTLARQPICDRELKLKGYELLYRAHNKANSAIFPDQEHATAQVMMTAMTEVGMELLTADVPSYINMTKEALIQAKKLNLSNRSVVF
ncbi:hypothetical protein [Pseudoalteromonas denitrificans]|uniref:EAL and modified HD-GYP domain-containing signal transduction protein n=1 Tax=Pseudoalteromonas denitrificans DSM 6059 TaxID=1123010 RepID=A0A1I1EKH5_9GAMM|nr:hypothetical protein [Pseudoalteromonas denitrificans]SFB87644.1 EAL and modified HD-GYP domain-containing signal transduction protein [Pseudoalteromonas denitrificans DSM 6059]